MYKKLEKLLKNSYSPYSNFPVSAITIWSNGSEVSGVNVESCAYPTSMCAERNAIFAAVSQGCRKLREVHIMVSNNEFSTACGACRQVIAEFADKKTLMYYYKRGTDEVLVENFFEATLPRAFTPADFLNKKGANNEN